MDKEIRELRKRVRKERDLLKVVEVLERIKNSRENHWKTQLIISPNDNALDDFLLDRIYMANDTYYEYKYPKNGIRTPPEITNYDATVKVLEDYIKEELKK